MLFILIYKRCKKRVNLLRIFLELIFINKINEYYSRNEDRLNDTQYFFIGRIFFSSVFFSLQNLRFYKDYLISLKYKWKHCKLLFDRSWFFYYAIKNKSICLDITFVLSLKDKIYSWRVNILLLVNVRINFIENCLHIYSREFEFLIVRRWVRTR